MVAIHTKMAGMVALMVTTQNTELVAEPARLQQVSTVPSLERTESEELPLAWVVEVAEEDCTVGQEGSTSEVEEAAAWCLKVDLWKTAIVAATE